MKRLMAKAAQNLKNGGIHQHNWLWSELPYFRDME